jgi:hypothetical protein
MLLGGIDEDVVTTGAVGAADGDVDDDGRY